MRQFLNKNLWIKKLLIAILWIAIWELLSLFIHNAILFAGPWDTLQALIVAGQTPEFYISIGKTLLSIFCGFLGGSVLGILLGAASYFSKIMNEMLSPMVRVIRTAPVASFIILILIWVGASQTAGVISGIVVFPFWYLATKEGLGLRDSKMLELGKLMKIPFRGRFQMITFSALYPQLRQAAEISIGMAFRSGVAAEVIGQPLRTIGNGLYRSKVSLDTPRLFAWTFITILLSWVLEHVVKWLFRRVDRKMVLPHPRQRHSGNGTPHIAHPGELEFLEVSKYYQDICVLKKLNHKFDVGSVTVLTGPSGSGKTTMIRLMTGLEQPTTGQVMADNMHASPIGIVFQESRLSERHSALQNLLLSLPGITEEKAGEELKKLLPEESLYKPVSELSGGMRRRVEIVRACMCASDVLFFDEPLTGLDEENARLAVSYISKERRGRTVIISTHRPELWQEMGVEIKTIEMGESHGNKRPGTN